MPGSENWETYSEQSEPEASSNYYIHPPVRSKRFTPESGHHGSPRNTPGKKQRGLRGVDDTRFMVEGVGGQMIKVSGSEAGWTDEDGY